ncbi:MAG: ornithine carbamoyltransferase, partial [Fimbriimonadales bacterium]
EGYEPASTIVQQCERIGRQTGGSLQVMRDPIEAVAGADVVYTDVWVSMGYETEREVRTRQFTPYQVNRPLMRLAQPDAMVLHCLPAHRGEEITSDVLDGPQSAVWDQAENRLHTQKALLSLLLCGG